MKTRATSTVGALISSTVAGLRAIVEGVVAAPGDFVNDFRSRRASHGGLVEAVSRSGGRVYVAGPYLWADLYKPWIEDHLSVFGLSRDDPTVLRAVQAASARPQYQLVIAHFSGPDVAAHLYGAASDEYSASVTWCDKAISELTQSAGDDTLVIVTSDHGVTAAGGHGGAEPVVTRTPLLASSPMFAVGHNELRQTEVPYLIAAALGVRISQHEPFSAKSHPSSTAALCIVAVLAGNFAVLRILTSTAAASTPKHAAFWLNTSVWVCLGIAWFSPAIAFAVSLSVLAFFAWQRTSNSHRTLTFVFAGATILGLARLFAGSLMASAESHSHVSLTLTVAVCLAALLLGFHTGSKAQSASRHQLIGIGFGLTVISLSLMAILGESVSLSSLDVRLAFRLIETPLGLPGAIAFAALRPFLPLLILIAGLLASWIRTRHAHIKIVPVAVGIGAAIAGELTLATLMLAVTNSQQIASLALGLLVRECAQITVIFPALAAAVSILRQTENRATRMKSKTP